MDLAPKSFDILNFYDQETCFFWDDEQLALFPYDDESSSPPPIRFLVAPAKIRSIKSYNGRIFLVCDPSGVYKLSKAHQFAVLSKTAIGIGAEHYEVLCVRNNYISLDNKQDRNCRIVFKHCSTGDIKPCIVAMNNMEIEDNLNAALLEDPNNSNAGLYVVTDGNEVYKVLPDRVQLIYSYFNPIVDIIPVKQTGKIMCLLLITNKNTVVLMYARNNQLVFEKLYLNTRIKALCAGSIEHAEDTIWIMHSDGRKTYNTRKVFGRNSVDRIDLDAPNIICLRNTDAGVYGLIEEEGDLIKLSPIFPDNTEDANGGNFVNLEREMLEGTDFIVDTICEKARRLQSLDKELEVEQKSLKRINMFACKRRFNLDPKMQISSIAGKPFLTANFGNGLPENSWVTLSVRSGDRKVFSTKIVSEVETKIEMPLPEVRLSGFMEVVTDLVVHAEEGYSWCPIKDCIKISDKSREALKKSKVNFVNAKLAVLNNLRSEMKYDVEKLIAIRDSARRELQNV